MTNARHARLFLIPTLLLAVLIAGCGSGTPTSSPTIAPTSAVVPPTTDPGNPPGGSSTDITFEDAYGNLLIANSYHFVIKAENPKASPSTTTTLEGDHDKSNKSVVGGAWHFTVNSTDMKNPNQGEWIIIEDKYYQKGTDGVWKEATFEDTQSLLYAPLLIFFPIDRTDSQLIGSEPAGGQDADHYQFTAKDKTYDAWVSKATGRLVQLKIASECCTYTTSLSKYDEPVTPITAPK
jgi:hypothetical protein